VIFLNGGLWFGSDGELRRMGSTSRRRPLYGRLDWLDELRLIAILVMILDHALLILAPDGAWPGVIRLTITRCAEPLFVFVLAYLTIYLKRPMKMSRWCEVAVAAVITSSTLTHVLGYAVADILVSIAVVAPFLPLILGLPRKLCFVGLHACAILAALPIAVFGISFDYSPLLIVHQVILTRLHSEGGLKIAGKHGLISVGLLVAASALIALVATPSASVFVVLFGHPIAALIISLVQRQEIYQSTPLTRIARRPLTVYTWHLVGLAGFAGLMRIASV
jgi:hypothetical protein